MIDLVEEHRAKDPLVGTRILDQYRIVDVLAKGGMGKIYLAEQFFMDRYAAVKIVRSDGALGSRTEADKRFRQEARAASRLQHPNVITVYNFGELSDGSHFLAMEYVDGVSLDKIIERGPQPLRWAIDVARQCAMALGYAHRNKVVHRDFKPANVMVTEASDWKHVVVLDFGIARLVEMGTEQSKTNISALLGTPCYMCPEQCRGEVCTALSDQYALGLVLYEILTGQQALVSETAVGYLHKHLHEVPPPPSEAHPTQHMEQLDPVVMRMIAKSPRDRYGDMDQLVQELTKVEEKLMVLAPGTSGVYPAVRSQLYEVQEETVTDFAQLATVSDKERASKQQRPTQVKVLGTKEVLPDAGWQALEREDLQVQTSCRTTLELKTQRHQGEEADLWVLGVPESRWDITWKKWATEAVSAEKTLVCIDSTLDAHDLAGAVDLFQNVLIGPHPIDPTVMSTALAWMAWNESGGIQCLLPSAACQMIQITSSSKKSFYIDTLLDAARSEGVRQRALRAVAELAEEMIMNAIFNAPVDDEGQPRYAHLGRDCQIVLPPEEEPTLSWLIGKRYVAISIRDRFGSLSAKEIFSRITGEGCVPNLDRDRGGAGIGLRIMSRSAQHLIFTICPGNWCEVLALVPQRPLSSSGGQSLCVLQGIGQEARRIGDRLLMRQSTRQDVVLVALKGEIDGSCDLEPLFSFPGKVLVDLGGVAYTEESGVQQWLDVSRRRNGDGQQLFLERCSPSIVGQFNAIPSFFKGCKVTSIMAPYYCPGCRKGTLEVLQVNDLERDDLPPDRLCAECHQELMFDEFSGEFFAFLFQ